MAGPFEQATKVAIGEIIDKHGTESKFGRFLSEEARLDLIDELFDLLAMSRTLKASGDRLIGSTARSEQDL